MIKYWWAILVGAVFGLCSCQWEDTTENSLTYPINNITAYKGQNVSSLMDDNGAPNIVQNMPDGSVAWIYYTNYRPVGGGELISYDVETNNNPMQTTCTVKVILQNEVVSDVLSECQ